MTLARQIPRKKLPLVRLDLDGDGSKEELRVVQQQPARDWRGKDRDKGPHFTLEVRAAPSETGTPGALLGSKRLYGWGQGWGQIGARVAGQGRVALAYWGVPEDHEARGTYAWLVKTAQQKAQQNAQQREVRWGELKRLPLELIDLRGDGREAVLTLSQELYHDYLKRGTTDLLRWDGAGFVSALRAPVFELCVLRARRSAEAGGDNNQGEDGAEAEKSSVWLVAVTSNKRELQLLRPATTPSEPLDVVWKTAVKPPDEGGPFTVPTGFALSCDRDAQVVQYKRRRFQLRGQQLVPLKDAPPPPGG